MFIHLVLIKSLIKIINHLPFKKCSFNTLAHIYIRTTIDHHYQNT